MDKDTAIHGNSPVTQSPLRCHVLVSPQMGLGFIVARLCALAIHLPSSLSQLSWTFSDTYGMPLTTTPVSSHYAKDFKDHLLFLMFVPIFLAMGGPPTLLQRLGNMQSGWIFFSCCLFHKMFKKYFFIAKEVKCL